MSRHYYDLFGRNINIFRAFRSLVGRDKSSRRPRFLPECSGRAGLEQMPCYDCFDAPFSYGRLLDGSPVERAFSVENLDLLPRISATRGTAPEVFGFVYAKMFWSCRWPPYALLSARCFPVFRDIGIRTGQKTY